MTKFKFILFLLISVNSFLFAQKAEVNFNAEIITLNQLGKAIISSETDDEKYNVNKNYKETLKKILDHPASFDYAFDSLKTISILKANELKIYNWAIPLTDGTYEYFALLQFKKSKNEYEIIELIDKSDEIKTPETKMLTQKNWYGALYYKIIYNKKFGENYYTVLGWDGNNNLTNKKIIDVISISNNGIAKLGAPIFKTKAKTKKRVIFEYSEDVVMSLKYHQNLGKIVFDYLVPASSKLQGIYEYYGPDLKRFDAFIANNGKWIYEEDTDIKLDRSIKDNMWKDPQKK